MFLSILLPLSRNLTPSLRTTVPSELGISMYQKSILPYFVIPSTFSPQASSPLERYGRTDREMSSPPVP